MQQHPDTLTTTPFKLSRSAYERYVAARWLGRRGWWLVGLPIAAAVAVSLATADLRWVLVALIYIFIIAPGIISMAYFRYLLTPEARLTALSKSLTIKPGDSITVHYEPEPESSQSSEYSESSECSESSLPPAETIPWAEVTAIRPSGQNIAIELRPKPHPRFIIVPRAAIADESKQRFLTLLTSAPSATHKK